MKTSDEDPIQLMGRLEEGIDGILDAEMSTALHDLVDAGSVASGDLAEQDMAALLGRIFRDGITGRLRVRRKAVEKAVYFEAGLPVMAASNDAADRMLAMLVREGAIDIRQRDETMRVVDATGRKVGAVLIDLGFLRSDELLPAVRRHYESVILSLFSWNTGTWQIDAEVTAGPERTRLLRHPAAIVRQGLELESSDEKIAARLGTEKKVFFLDASANAADMRAQVVMDKAEARAPMLFDGVRSFAEVVRSSGIPEGVVLRIALTLSCFGVLHAVEASSSVGGHVGLRDLGIGRERVQARYALALDGDYFSVLGVSRISNAQDIRRAHTRLSGDIAPEVLGPELWHELRQQIETIQEVLDEALRILSTPTLRAAYEFNLAHGPDAEGEPENRAVTPAPSLGPRG